MEREVLCIIPARLGSTRLPAKPLVEIQGTPLVVWSCRNAEASGAFGRVVVATDAMEIADAVTARGHTALLTSPDHQSGTDRVYEAAQQFAYPYVVNIQGDEPDLPHDILRDFSRLCRSTCSDNSLLTCVSHATIESKTNRNSVKVVLNNRNEALYFSRAPIPCVRDGTDRYFLKHKGIYGFSQAGLGRFCSFEAGNLEQLEKLEQLRALENGMVIHCLVRDFRSTGIDTPEDLENFKQQVERKER